MTKENRDVREMRFVTHNKMPSISNVLAQQYIYLKCIIHSGTQIIRDNGSVNLSPKVV